MKPTKKETIQLVGLLVGVVALVITAFILYDFNSKNVQSASDLNLQETWLQNDIDDLNMQLSSYTPVNEDDVSSGTLHSSRVAGEIVAEYQNEFSDSGTLPVEEWEGIASSLTDCFDDASLTTAQSQWVMLRTYEWRYETNYYFMGDTQNAMWVCYVGTRPVAYATAVYSVEDMYFSQLHVSLLNTISRYHMEDEAPTVEESSTESEAMPEQGGEPTNG